MCFDSPVCRNCFRDWLKLFSFFGGGKCQHAFLNVCDILSVKVRYRELSDVAAYFC